VLPAGELAAERGLQTDTRAAAPSRWTATMPGVPVSVTRIASRWSAVVVM
jgi:hypothetical protein